MGATIQFFVIVFHVFKQPFQSTIGPPTLCQQTLFLNTKMCITASRAITAPFFTPLFQKRCPFWNKNTKFQRSTVQYLSNYLQRRNPKYYFKLKVSKMLHVSLFHFVSNKTMQENPKSKCVVGTTSWNNNNTKTECRTATALQHTSTQLFVFQDFKVPTQLYVSTSVSLLCLSFFPFISSRVSDVS